VQTRAEVRIAACDGTLKMTIKDDGTGFDLAVAARGLGLATMRERLRLVGGELVVSSKLGEGTEIMAQAKLNPPLSQTAAA
jgi:signal transduction histidine kinase